MNVWTSARVWAGCLTVFLSMPAAGSATDGPKEERRVSRTLTWDTAAEWEDCFRDRFIDNFTDRKKATLVDFVLVADEMGKGYNDFQQIGGKTQAKKILVIDSAEVKSAQLMIGGDVGGCDIVVNGVVSNAEPMDPPGGRPYWPADFDRYLIQVKLLKSGPNEFVFRAKADKGGGKIRIENCQQPNRSAVSRDGGHSWDSDRLGEGGYCNGELQVRLKLGRRAPKGWIASPIMDLAQTAGKEIPDGLSPRLDDLQIEADVPEGAAVEKWVRLGPTPDGSPRHWTRWYFWDTERKMIPDGHRFAQWKLVLKTDLPQKAPVVNGVKLTCSSVPVRHDGQPLLSIGEDKNHRIVRSSYDFAYSAYDGNLGILRKHWKVGDVIDGKSSEMEQFIALRQWVRDQWKNGWSMGELNYIPSWDARVILTLASKNLSLGMCTHYATTFVQCSQALGLSSRSMFIGHALSESWSNEHGRWMIMDPGADPDDARRCTYHLMRNGVPLNLLELHRARFIDKEIKDIRMIQTNMSLKDDNPSPPFKPDEEAVAKFLDGVTEIFMPLRNNFIDHREPEEPEHGQGNFKHLLHLFWKDEATPDVPWTDFFTTRAADMYWTINQAQIFLHRADPSGSKLEVMLDTVTPNFARYEIRVNGGEWQPLPGDAKTFERDGTGVAALFLWKMNVGDNVLEARTINAAGRAGMVSRIAVHALVER